MGKFHGVVRDAAFGAGSGEARQSRIGKLHGFDRECPVRAGPLAALGHRLVGLVSLPAAKFGIAGMQTTTADWPDLVDLAASLGAKECAGDARPPTRWGVEIVRLRIGAGQAGPQARTLIAIAVKRRCDRDRLDRQDCDVLEAARIAARPASERCLVLDPGPRHAPRHFEGRCRGGAGLGCGPCEITAGECIARSHQGAQAQRDRRRHRRLPVALRAACPGSSLGVIEKMLAMRL